MYRGGDSRSDFQSLREAGRHGYRRSATIKIREKNSLEGRLDDFGDGLKADFCFSCELSDFLSDGRDLSL
jgi:hypothetical protein